MTEENLYNDDVRQYLQMMQENITRMAINSSNAKTWFVTIVAAFLAIGCSMESLKLWLLLALIPNGVFWYLDAFYLRLERQLRNREQYFINILRDKEASGNEEDFLYDFRPLAKKKNDKDLRYVETNCQMFNKSVCPLYLVMAVIILAVTQVL